MDVDPGLCARCKHASQVRTPRAVYWLCKAAQTDPRLSKYPRLPVLACHAYIEKIRHETTDPHEA